MLINTYIYIMRIVIYIIYVHNDVDVSAYEYANVCADRYVNVSVDLYVDMKVIMILVIVNIYICTSWKMKIDFPICKYSPKMKF